MTGICRIRTATPADQWRASSDPQIVIFSYSGRKNDCAAVRATCSGLCSCDGLLHLAVFIEELDHRRTIGWHLYLDALLAPSVTHGQRRGAIVVAAHPNALLVVFVLFAVRYRQTGIVIVLVIDANELNHLVGVISVKRQCTAGIRDLTLRIALSAKDQTAILGALIVEAEKLAPANLKKRAPTL